MEFGNNELIMLKAMLTDPSKDWTLESLFKETGWDDQVHIAGSGNVLSDLKYLEINEHITNFISLGQEDGRLVPGAEHPFPETIHHTIFSIHEQKNG